MPLTSSFSSSTTSIFRVFLLSVHADVVRYVPEQGLAYAGDFQQPVRLQEGAVLLAVFKDGGGLRRGRCRQEVQLLLRGGVELHRPAGAVPSPLESSTAPSASGPGRAAARANASAAAAAAAPARPMRLTSTPLHAFF